MISEQFFGSRVERGGAFFRVWAPGHDTVEVVLYGPGAERVQALEPEGGGFWSGRVDGAGEGSRYKFRFGGDVFPDPASRAQPDGVHGASRVVATDGFAWTDDGWRGVPLDEMSIYELHVGTFTDAGTFDAAIERLDDLRDLGVTAVEIMPVADFPGDRNWGYDGVFLYAPAMPTAGRRA